MANISHLASSHGGTTPADSTFIPAMWANIALGLLHQNAVMPKLVTRDYEPIVARQGRWVEIPKRGTLTAQAKAANTAVTLQNPTPSRIQITLDKHYDVSFLVEDVTEAQSSVKNMLGYMEDGMAAIAKQVDTDLLSLYTGCPAAQIITRSTGVMVEADVLTARQLLNANEIPMENRYFVVYDQGDLLAISRFTEAHIVADPKRIKEGAIGRIHGFDVFEDPRVVVDATSASIHNQLFFWRDALALVTRPLPLPPKGSGVQAFMAHKDGLGIRLLYGYNISHKGMQCSVDILYGVGVVRNEGIVLYRV